MIVMKFGGSSVANAERIRHMADIVMAYRERKPVVVLSAMGDTTDHLLAAADEALKKGVVHMGSIEDSHLDTVIELKLGDRALRGVRPLLEELRTALTGISLIRELTGRTIDYLVSFGERLSVRIAAAYFNSIGVNARAVDAWDAGFLSDSRFTQAELLPEAWKLIPAKLAAPVEEGVLLVVTGFIAKDKQENITTLGRGGSDLTATMIGASCGAEEVQVWKDVDGILSADPRIVKNARVIEALSYDAAAELAYYGAQVLHPRTMQPCIKTGTPVLVKNSYNRSSSGTLIAKSSVNGGKKQAIQAISFRANITLVDIVSSRMLGQYGFLAEVFSCFARHHLSVDMVATSEVSVSVTLNSSDDLSGLKKDLDEIASVEIKTGRAIVTIIADVGRSSEILARAFRTCQLIAVPVQMVSQGASKVNISFIVNDEEAADVVRALHADFFEE